MKIKTFLFFSIFSLYVYSYNQARTDPNDPSSPLLSWRQRCIYYTIYEQGTKDIQGKKEFYVVEEAFRRWKKAIDHCSYLEFKRTQNSECHLVGYNPKSYNSNLIIWQESWPPSETDNESSDYDPYAIALTTLSFNYKTGEILDADIEINDSKFQFTISNKEEEIEIDLLSTFMHEIGHLLGLDEVYDDSLSEVTMYYKEESGETKKRTLEHDDIKGICDIYPKEKDPGICRGPTCGLRVRCEEGKDACKDTLPKTGCNCSSQANHSSLSFLSFFILILIRNIAKLSKKA